MKKAVIICAQGMSSSLIARKTQELLQSEGFDVVIDAATVAEGKKVIDKNEHDLYLISPQAKVYAKPFQEAVDKLGKPLVHIPPQAYIPIPMALAKMVDLVKSSLF